MPTANSLSACLAGKTRPMCPRTKLPDSTSLLSSNNSELSPSRPQPSDNFAAGHRIIPTRHPLPQQDEQRRVFNCCRTSRERNERSSVRAVPDGTRVITLAYRSEPAEESRLIPEPRYLCAEAPLGCWSVSRFPSAAIRARTVRFASSTFRLLYRK